MGAQFKAAASRRPRSAAFKPAALALALSCALTLNPDAVQAQSNPSGGVAIHGQMSLSNPAPNQLRITTQNGAGTNHSAINWQSFSIGASNSTVFVQPSASSTAINRVVTNTPSAIFGSLSSNGRLVLVNQSGIAVGAGAVIDTAGFTASALRMNDADALTGRLRFGDANASMGGAGGITVDGRITAHNGDVVLIAPNIEVGISALLKAPNGSTVLAAGQQVEITGRGLEGISMLVQAPGDTVRNLGSLRGDAVGIFAGTLRHSGDIQATTANLEGGTVVLKASADAMVEGAGKIIAAGGVGGHVDVLGNRVAIAGQALIDVSGAKGGGVIRVGGDYQGGNTLVPNAQMTYLGPEAVLKANATAQGDAGKVIVWADEVTRAYGSIEANAAGGGGGGLVETSGHRYLDVNGIRVLASGSQERPATWLLDPANVTITHAAAPGALGGMTSNTAVFGPGTQTSFIPVDAAATSTLTDANINQFINAGSNLIVVITTANPSISGGAAGDITFDGSTAGAIVIDRTNNANASANTLRFDADRDIKFTSGSTTFRRSGASTGKALTVELNPGTTSAGKISVSSGATVVLDGVNDELGINVKNGKVWENAGTVTMNGMSVIRIPNETSYASFSNLVGGVLNINASSNWSFLSDNLVQGGILTNAGTINVSGLAVGNSTSWEALFSNLAGGTLNVGAAKLLSMQNGGTLGGTVFIDTGGTLLLSEQHAGPVAFTNTAFSGAGALNIGNPVTANFNGSSGTLGQLNVGGVANLQSGTLNVGSYSQPVGSSSLGGAGNLNVSSSFNHSGGSFTPTGNLSITQASGNLNFNETVSVASLNLTASTGVLVTSGAATSSGGVTFTADDMTIAGSINAPSATVTLRPASLARNTAIEASNSGSVLSLQPGELQLVTANVLAIGRLDGTGNLGLTTSLTSANIIANSLQLVAGNDLRSNTGANIGSAGAPFNHSLDLFANNDVQLTYGNVFVADNKRLNAHADFDGSGAGAVRIGGITLQAGNSAGNTTGDMLLTGHDVVIGVSGGGSADIRVTGSGAQNIDAANTITIANSNTTSGNLLVGTGSGPQTMSAPNFFVASAGSGTATYTQIYSDGNQFITAGGLLLAAGASGSGNDVSVVSFLGSQSITVGAGGLQLSAGGGGASDNFAALYQFGTTGASQTITVNGGGGVTLQGGSSAGTNVGSGSGSFAKIQSNGDSQQINFVSAGTLAMLGGTTGSNNYALIEAANGSQTISGATSISLGGGASGGVAGEGNSAHLNAATGTQTVSAANIFLQGGVAGTSNVARISSTGNQSISADSLSLAGGAGGGGTGTGNLASINTSASQTITVGGGGLTLTGGGGSLTDNAALVVQSGAAGTSQTITVNGAGLIVMQGGSSLQSNVGGATHGSRALIEGDGNSQTINFTDGGSIDLTGGTNGSRAYAQIYAANGSQTITGPAGISLTGGANGGFANEGNFATISAQTGTQMVSAGTIALQGGAAGVENSASMVAPTQVLAFNGDLSLGGGGADIDSGARIGGRSAGNTNLNLSVTGNITLAGGATNGTAIGAARNSTGIDSRIVVNASGNIALNPSATQSVRIGASAAAAQTGSVGISAGGTIALNSGGGSGVAAVRSLGDVSLLANAISDSGAISGAHVDLHGASNVSLSGTSLINATATSGKTLTVEVDSGAFGNTTGAGVFGIAPGGRWLVYSVNPANDLRGGLVFDFKQYGALPASPVRGTGNGFLYSITPTLNASLVGALGKVYDGNASAAPTATNFSVSGLAGDVVTLGSLGTGAYDTRNVGAGKTVTVNGASVVSVADGGKPVFGYAGTIGTLSASIGAISILPTATWTGSAGDNRWSNAGNWSGGALPDGANVAGVLIPAGAGSVVMDSAATGVTLQSINSARPLTQNGGSLISPLLTLDTQAGISLDNPANRISALKADNQGVGNLLIVNSVPLSLVAMTNSGGGISVTNTGAINSASGLISAPNGDVAITANSPLTIGAGGVSAGGNIVLTASNLTSAGNLTLNGPITAGNTVSLIAGQNLLQNSAVRGANGVSATAGGTIRYGPLASSNNPPVSYSAAGVSVASPPRAASDSAASNETAKTQVDLLVTFLDAFEKTLDRQQSSASDTNQDGSRKKNGGDIVTEGEVCR